jgi:photosystem II stability/assembly factor-like uncharacterized protein
MLFIQLLVALAVFFAQVEAQPAWRSGETANVVLGVAPGASNTEVYGAVYSKNNGGGKLYYSADRSHSQTGQYITAGALNMDVAVSNDGQTVAVTGPGGVFTGEAGSNFAPTTAGLTNVVSQDIQPLSDSGFAAIGRFTKDTTDINGVAYSRDGGATWAVSDLGLDKSQGYYARHGSFPTDNIWYVTSGDWPNQSDAKLTNGNVARVSSRISVMYDEGAGNPLVTFISARNLQGTYPGAISKTTDGGATWTKVFDSAGRFYLNKISCIDGDNCFAVGEDAKSAVVLATTDGGATWETKMSLRGPLSLRAVAMVSASEIFVSGGTISSGPAASREIVGNYYRSTDGGATWTTASHNGYGFDLSFKNGVGYAAALFRRQTDIWIWE